jgi:preprotein translocase subunit SecA
MIGAFIKKLFGTKHERETKKLLPVVDEINRYYEEYQSLSDGELKELTPKFRQRILKRVKSIQEEISDLRSEFDTSFEEGRDAAFREEIRERIQELEEEEKTEIRSVLDEILPEAFAAVKEVCRRLMGKTWDVVGNPTRWDMIPYDVQLTGAVVLHQGKIAEMATGEGKTLAATMPLYLNALPGRGVHLVTVNDYLARRDAEWMGQIYEFLGLRVAFITNDMNSEERRIAYNADITYGTNNEFGFDYLRDNMSHSLDDVVQRSHYYAIVDEVDSVLIDEARTPLIISGPVSHSTHKYDELRPLVDRLVKNQTVLVNQLVADGERLLEEGEEYEAGIKLLQGRRGAPKNKRLLKLKQEPGLAKLMQRIENDYLRDKKVHELDEELYYAIDEKSNVTDLTDKGRLALSPDDDGGMFVIPDVDALLTELEKNEDLTAVEMQEERTKIYQHYGEVSERAHNVAQLLKAYSLFEKDVEYVVSDNKVMIVDEFTGRLMPGRRFSDGLHQALEAKENVRIERETQTLATITLQNYFRMYDKLAGMTGTAETEAGEFWEIYKLDVVVIPTNMPCIRADHEDVIFRTKREKYNAVIEEIEEMNKMRRPVLVGTVSVDVSELLSRMLKRRGIRHSVLNAKYHQQEAEIVTRAGEPGMVTIATNMAGRGTDIKLGAGVAADLGGLHILATERHEARRIDLQLRGRSGRQGDPGSTRFYLGLEDDLMRLFGSERIAAVMDRLGLEEGEVIQHRMVTKSIERAQKKVEAQNFGIRKHLLEYDDVMNKQRENIYRRRNHALREANLKDDVLEMLQEFVEDKVETFTNQSTYSEEWDWDGLKSEFLRVMLLEPQIDSEQIATISQDELIDLTTKRALEFYKQREESLGADVMRQLEKVAMLHVIDERWKEHLYEMDMLKEGIGLRAYGQKNPLLEYKQEGFHAFTEMLASINELVLELVFKAQPANVADERRRRVPQEMEANHASSLGMGYQYAGVDESDGSPVQAMGRTVKQKPIRVEQKIGRNQPCPCGSGKKYKHCHGR